MLQVLNEAIVALTRIPNVMVNNPARHTGPAALKTGFIVYQNEVGVITSGYRPAGIYEGAMREDGSFRTANETIFGNDEKGDISSRNTTNKQERRYVTVVGDKRKSNQYVHRSGLKAHTKATFMNAGGMPHYHTSVKEFRVPIGRKISCRDHIAREEKRIRTLNITLPLLLTTDETSAYPRYKKANYVRNEEGLLVDADDPARPSVDGKNNT